MAHRYHETILVRRAPIAPGPPAAFLWRGLWYQVDAVLATWRLRDRWWATPTADVAAGMDGMDAAADVLPPTERVYYRVRCVDPQGEQIFDLYHDAVSGQWVLDRAHD